eukprot:scaffold567_cov170-Amphora_coffeaeformis.AAC.8
MMSLYLPNRTLSESPRQSHTLECRRHVAGAGDMKESLSPKKYFGMSSAPRRLRHERVSIFQTALWNVAGSAEIATPEIWTRQNWQTGSQRPKRRNKRVTLRWWIAYAVGALVLGTVVSHLRTFQEQEVEKDMMIRYVGRQDSSTPSYQSTRDGKVKDGTDAAHANNRHGKVLYSRKDPPKAGELIFNSKIAKVENKHLLSSPASQLLVKEPDWPFHKASEAKLYFVHSGKAGNDNKKHWALCHICFGGTSYNGPHSFFIIPGTHRRKIFV